MSLRGKGFRVNKTQYVSGTPLVYITPTTEVLPLNGLLRQGSTMGGALGTLGTTVPTKERFICMRATTGAQTLIPFLRIDASYELIAPVASSETVISTTQIGQQVAFSSSGTCLCPATTGYFAISGVFNTSGVTAQYLTGRFQTAVATTA